MRGHWYPNLHYGFMMLSKKKYHFKHREQSLFPMSLFQTTLSFEPSCLWICHQPFFSQTRRRQHWCCINSIQFLGSFHTWPVKSFSKFLITWILAFYFSQKFQRKYSMATSLTFIVIEIENLKEPRSGLLGLNHVVIQEKSIVITNMWQWDHERYS